MTNPIPRDILDSIANRRAVDSPELGIKANPITMTTDLHSELGQDTVNNHPMSRDMEHALAETQANFQEGRTRAVNFSSYTPTYYVTLHGNTFAFITHDGKVWARKDWKETTPPTAEEARMSDYLRASLGHAAALQAQDYWVGIAELSY